ncbi:hypothetical protein [uncultured Xylophilus sp.]|uniref:hypothetical protein n=1 Tax=uncultured Xylophilus sp. TaxID=296832 RepID=UPI0025FC0379|nr:hypothetical protein [uncultured Xylophilus sp.]
MSNVSNDGVMAMYGAKVPNEVFAKLRPWTGVRVIAVWQLVLLSMGFAATPCVRKEVRDDDSLSKEYADRRRFLISLASSSGRGSLAVAVQSKFSRVDGNTKVDGKHAIDLLVKQRFEVDAVGLAYRDSVKSAPSLVAADDDNHDDDNGKRGHRASVLTKLRNNQGILLAGLLAKMLPEELAGASVTKKAKYIKMVCQNVPNFLGVDAIVTQLKGIDMIVEADSASIVHQSA